MGWTTRAIQLLLAGLLALATFGTGAASAQTCTKTWTGSPSGAWETDGNWTPSGAPGASDAVCIPRNTAVTLSSSTAIDGLRDAGNLTIAENGSLTAAATVDDSGGSITLQGNCILDDSATLVAARITNAGTLDLDHTGLCASGSSTVAATNTLTNTGTIELTGTNGAFNITGTVVNEGRFTIGSGLSLTLQSDTSLTDAAGTINIQGSLAIQGTYTQGNGEVVTDPITLDDGSSVDFAGDGRASLSVGGNSTVGVSGTIAAAQTLDVQGVSTCVGSEPATLNAAGALVNEGTLLLDHSGPCPSGAVTLNAPAGLTNKGVLEITGTAAPDSITGALTNRGGLSIGSGLELAATLTQAAGITAIGQGATLSQSTGSVELVAGELTGAGTVAGSLDNYGGVVNLSSAPETMTVTGTYIQGTNGSLAIYAGGGAAGQHSLLVAGAGVVLGGRATVVPSPAYAASAAVGDSVAFLVYTGQRVGELASIGSSPPLADGRTFAAGYDDAHGTVDAVVQPGPPAISLTAPAAGAIYKLGKTLHASYTCTEGGGGPGLASCVGSLAVGALIPTGTPGPKTFTIIATSLDGLSETRIVHYAIAPPSNRFKVTDVNVRRSGVTRLRVRLRGPGRLVVSAKLRRPRSLTLFSTRIEIRSPGTLHFTAGPVGKTRRRLAHIRRHKLLVLLTITYQPTGGKPRTLVVRQSFRARPRPR
jgi:hypothetical protein